jgi:hypothetical protein
MIVYREKTIMKLGKIYNHGSFSQAPNKSFNAGNVHTQSPSYLLLLLTFQK